MTLERDKSLKRENGHTIKYSQPDYHLIATDLAHDVLQATNMRLSSKNEKLEPGQIKATIFRGTVPYTVIFSIKKD